MSAEGRLTSGEAIETAQTAQTACEECPLYSIRGLAFLISLPFVICNAKYSFPVGDYVDIRIANANRAKWQDESVTTKFYIGRLRPEVQSPSLLYTIFHRKGTPLYLP